MLRAEALYRILVVNKTSSHLNSGDEVWSHQKHNKVRTTLFLMDHANPSSVSILVFSMLNIGEKRKANPGLANSSPPISLFYLSNVLCSGEPLQKRQQQFQLYIICMPQIRADLLYIALIFNDFFRVVDCQHPL